MALGAVVADLIIPSALQLCQLLQCFNFFMPTGGLPFCPCRKETKTRQRGEIPDLSPLWTPLIQTAKRGAPLLDIPVEGRSSGALEENCATGGDGSKPPKKPFSKEITLR